MRRCECISKKTKKVLISSLEESIEKQKEVLNILDEELKIEPVNELDEINYVNLGKDYIINTYRHENMNDVLFNVTRTPECKL